MSPKSKKKDKPNLKDRVQTEEEKEKQKLENYKFKNQVIVVVSIFLINIFAYYDLDIGYVMRKYQTPVEMQYIRLMAASIVFFSGTFYDQLSGRKQKAFYSLMVIVFSAFKFKYQFDAYLDQDYRDHKFYV